MATRFLLDTNVAIFFLKSSLPEHAKRFLIGALAGERSTISFITQIEPLAFPTITPFEEKEVADFIKYFTPLWIDEAIISETIAIRRKTKIKLPDAIIAATALVSNLKLISSNTDDFKKVEGLKIINPLTL